MEDYTTLRNMLKRRTEASEHLAEISTVSCVLEITLNLPRHKIFKSLNIIEQIDVYKNIWSTIKASLNASEVYDSFHIEHCKDGLPHLHGYLRLKGLTPHYHEGLVMDVVRTYYKQIPSVYWKQISKGEYNNSLSRFRAPAICINYKNFLHEEWENYINKCV